MGDGLVEGREADREDRFETGLLQSLLKSPTAIGG